MGKQARSNLSDGQTIRDVEASDSNSTVLQNPSKRSRKAPSKVNSGRFKGVVPQQNGNWGAQIYANQKRIWLGTFKSEEDAAMAYDSAAIKLRTGDSHRNFPWTPESVEEPHFQSLFSQEMVLAMIKDGSYRTKFTNYLRFQADRKETQVAPAPNPVGLQGEGRGFLCRLLFQKELTPSDVGKLNRLVIPKKYAVKYFPQNSNKSGGAGKAGSFLDDVQLVFYDRTMRCWKFRYCYWSSSQSFVFTRGWNRFVKAKALQAGDLVSFYLCEGTDPAKENRAFCIIDVCTDQAGQLMGAIGRKDVIGNTVEAAVGSNAAAAANAGEAVGEGPGIPEKPTTNNNGFWLFGVHIN